MTTSWLRDSSEQKTPLRSLANISVSGRQVDRLGTQHRFFFSLRLGRKLNHQSCNQVQSSTLPKHTNWQPETPLTSSPTSLFASSGMPLLSHHQAPLLTAFQLATCRPKLLHHPTQMLGDGGAVTIDDEIVDGAAGCEHAICGENIGANVCSIAYLNGAFSAPLSPAKDMITAFEISGGLESVGERAWRRQ